MLLRWYIPGLALASPVTPVVSRGLQAAISSKALKDFLGAVRPLAQQVQRRGASSARQRQQQQLQQKLLKASTMASCLPALKGVPDTARRALEAHPARSFANPSNPQNQRSRQSSKFLGPPGLSLGLPAASSRVPPVVFCIFVCIAHHDFKFRRDSGHFQKLLTRYFESNFYRQNKQR